MYCVRGRGQGKMCGMLITTKDARRVPANKVDVAVDRGWRCDGMLDGWQVRHVCHFLRPHIIRQMRFQSL
jgi:hypothetical protein